LDLLGSRYFDQHMQRLMLEKLEEIKLTILKRLDLFMV